MVIYATSETGVSTFAARLRKIRIWIFSISGALLVLLIYLRISYSNLFGRNFDFLGILLIVAIAEAIRPNPLGRSFQQLAEKLGNCRVEITPDAVEFRSELFNKRIARNEIVRAEEALWGNGLYIRTAKRYRWIVIPRWIEGFEEIKSSLSASGIPVVQKRISPPWEERLFIILFLVSLTCDLFATSGVIQFPNLGLALLIGIHWYMVSAEVEDSRKRLKLRIAALIPLAVAGLAVLSRSGWF